MLAIITLLRHLRQRPCDMETSRVVVSIMVAAASLLSCEVGGKISERKSDVKCYYSYPNSDKMVCQTSLYTIIANPNRYEGVIIDVTGYLKRMSDALVLYPSRDAYVYGAGRNGVELLVANPDDIEIMRDKQDLEGATTVIGKFTSSVRGGMRGSVGAVAGEIAVFPASEPGTAPALPTNK